MRRVAAALSGLLVLAGCAGSAATPRAAPSTSTTEPLAAVPVVASPLRVSLDAASTAAQSRWDSFDLGGHRVLVLVPTEAQGTPTRPLPVVVLLHGEPGRYVDWVRGGNVDVQFDALLASGRLPPALLVMPDLFGADPHAAPGCPADTETFVVRDLLADIDRRYRTNGQYAIGGVSDGGGCAVLWATRHPDVFRAAFALVGYFRELPASSNGVAVLLEDGADDTASRRDSDAAAAALGTSVVLTPGDDHGWTHWRTDLGIALPFVVRHLRDSWPLRVTPPADVAHVAAPLAVPDGFARLLPPPTELRAPS